MTYQNNSKINISKNYTIIQGWMISDFGLKGNSLLIYAIIYGFSQAENCKFTGSLNYLATWTNSTKQGVIKSLKILQERGLINKEEFFSNGVKNVKYYTTKFNGGIKQSLMGGIKQSLPNNIEYNNIDNNIVINKQFEQFYNLYGKKKSPSDVKNKLKTALKKDSFENIMAGLDNYIKNRSKDSQFWKYPATWLNQECWKDEYNQSESNLTEDSFDRVLKEIQSNQPKLK
jgi:DNA-binding MarR family transcriptional regulator